jgi:TRAP-type mannitol/chloroaromatic compound transport system permease small subunit
MRNIINTIENIQEKIGIGVTYIAALLVLVVGYDVVSRYLFSISSLALQELEWHLFSILFLLSAGWTLKHDKHVRIDLFYNKLTSRNRHLINIIGVLIFLFPFCLIMIWSSMDFVVSSFSVGETSPDAGGLPARYLLKAILPISFILLLLQGIMLLINSIIAFQTEKQK